MWQCITPKELQKARKQEEIESLPNALHQLKIFQQKWIRFKICLYFKTKLFLLFNMLAIGWATRVQRNLCFQKSLSLLIKSIKHFYLCFIHWHPCNTLSEWNVPCCKSFTVTANRVFISNFFTLKQPLKDHSLSQMDRAAMQTHVDTEQRYQ